MHKGPPGAERNCGAELSNICVMKIAAYCPTPSGHLDEPLCSSEGWPSLISFDRHQALKLAEGHGQVSAAAWCTRAQLALPCARRCRCTAAEPVKRHAKEERTMAIPCPSLCSNLTRLSARVKRLCLHAGCEFSLSLMARLKYPLDTPADASMHLFHQQSRKGASRSTYVLHAKPEQGLWVAR